MSFNIPTAPRLPGRPKAMATPALTAAALAQNRHQGGLREYVNQRLAPHLKKALKDVCDVDAEYPLQWLGEHLINQSFLYENNPDTTRIKERFFYNFDPEPQSVGAVDGGGDGATAATTVEAISTTNTTSTMGAQLPVSSDAALEDLAPQFYDGDQQAVEGRMAAAEESYDVREHMDVGHEHHSYGEASTEMLNGVAEAAREGEGAGQVNGEEEGTMDTEMAGAD